MKPTTDELEVALEKVLPQVISEIIQAKIDAGDPAVMTPLRQN